MHEDASDCKTFFQTAQNLKRAFGSYTALRYIEKLETAKKKKNWTAEFPLLEIYIRDLTIRWFFKFQEFPGKAANFRNPGKRSNLLVLEEKTNSVSNNLTEMF